MKSLIKKYFDFIGVKNEGVRRLLTIIIVLFGFIFPNLIVVMDGNDLDLFYLFELYIFQEFESRWIYSLQLYLITLVPSPIIVGVVVKIFTWVKDGFKKGE